MIKSVFFVGEVGIEPTIGCTQNDKPHFRPIRQETNKDRKTPALPLGYSPEALFVCCISIVVVIVSNVKRYLEKKIKNSSIHQIK